MADTTFIDGTSIIRASWLNPVNVLAYRTIDNTSTNTQLTITNTSCSFSSTVNVPDDIFFSAGTSGDLRIIHLSSTNQSYLDNRTGTLNIQNNTPSQLINIQAQNSVGALNNGIKVGGPTPKVELYFGDVLKVETASGGANLPALATESSILTCGVGRAGNGYAGIDLIGDPIYPNYGLQILRENTGANAVSHMHHRGTGSFRIATIEAAPIDVWTNNTPRTSVAADGGFVVGSPTGGSQGAGTINAQAVYDDGVLLTDYVFDYYLDGKINQEDRTQALRLLQDTSVYNVDIFSSLWKKKRHLPSMPSREEFIENKLGVGALAQRLWETVELQAIHIDQLNTRLKQLEGNV